MCSPQCSKQTWQTIKVTRCETLSLRLSLRARCLRVCAWRARAGKRLGLPLRCMQLRGRLFSLCNNRRGRRWRRALSRRPVARRDWSRSGRSACSAAAAPVAQTAPARSPETPRASGAALRRNRTRRRACRSFARASAHLPHWHRSASALVGAEVPSLDVQRQQVASIDTKTDEGTREAPRIAWIRSRERFCRTKRHRRRSSRPARDLQNHSDRLGAVGFQARSCAITSVA
jgi:hypothetical protein